MTTFEQERNEIREKIWSLMDLNPDDRVLDVGVGHIAYSRNKLIELKTRLTSIDLNWSVLRKHMAVNANSVQCNASTLPFKDQVFVLALANFTFHEIDPALHHAVISELCRVSKRIMIVEPDFAEDPLCVHFQNIWTESMHSLNKFEDNKTIDYWIDLLRNCGLIITVIKRFPSAVRLCGQEARAYMKTVLENLKEEGVPARYIEKMTDFTEDVVAKGMIFSDVNVVIGKA